MVTPGESVGEWGFPVGRCNDSACRYGEPHRHGNACDQTCSCAGVGAVTAPLGDDDLSVCDWGFCDEEAVALRLDQHSASDDDWLSVCAWHAGWLDEREPVLFSDEPRTPAFGSTAIPLPANGGDEA